MISPKLLAKTEPVIIKGWSPFNAIGELHTPSVWMKRSYNLIWDDDTDRLAMRLAIARLGEDLTVCEYLMFSKFYLQWATNLQKLIKEK